MTKKHLKCDEHCTHKVKRTKEKKIKTGANYNKDKVITGATPPLIESVPDEIITGVDSTTIVNIDKDKELSTNSWINVASTMLNIPSGATQHKILAEIDRIFGAITLSDNVDAHAESVYIIDECLRKLVILKRDKQIA